jgi:excisionase family DNA binding protein
MPDELIERIAQRAAELLADGARTSTKVDTADGYLDVAGAAEFLACPTSRIYSLVSARRIPFHKDGSRLLFDRGELREYVAAGGAKRP